MNIKDWIYFVIILFTFFFMHIGNVMINQLVDTKINWGKHKCNPVTILFAGLFGGNAKENMNECIREEQVKNMKNSLSGFTQGLSKVTQYVSNNIKNIANTRFKLKMMGLANITNFLNIGKQFNAVSFQAQIIMAKLQDTFNKLMGIASGFLYMVDAGHMTVKSLDNGPLGNTFRYLEDQVACFHPETIVELYGGVVKQMQHIQVGDRLKSGKIVVATMIIKGNTNNRSNPYYELFSQQLQTSIYVTGTHHILYNEKDITINNHPDAKKVDLVSDTFSCLITENHLIPIGEHQFMDWEV